MHETVSYLYSQGWQPTSESGDELRGRCPYPYGHSGGTDENPSFSINQNTGAFNCKSCNSGGKSVISMIMLIERISKEEAVKKIFGTTNREERTLDEIRSDIKTYTRNVLSRDMDNIPEDIQKAREDVRKDLAKRNLPESVIARWGLGFTYKGMVKKLLKKFSLQQLEESGVVKNGLFFTVNRMSIPIISERRLIGFSLRSLDGTDPKYFNIYQEDETKWFFNLDRKQKEVFVTEGAFDAISLTEMGYNACASMGTAINRERIKLLSKFDTVYLVLDADKAGMNAVKKFIDLSRGILDQALLKIVNLPNGKDPDECTPEEVKTAVDNSQLAFAWLLNTYAQFAEPEKFIIGMKKLRQMASRYQKDEARIFELMIDQHLETYTRTGIQRYYVVDCETDIIEKKYDLEEDVDEQILRTI